MDITHIQTCIFSGNELERLEKDPSLSTSKVKDNLSVNEFKEIASLEDKKKIPIIHGIIKSKSEGKAKTIKEIRNEASSHKTKDSKPSKVTKKQLTKKEIEIQIIEIDFKIEALREKKKELNKLLKDKK